MRNRFPPDAAHERWRRLLGRAGVAAALTAAASLTLFGCERPSDVPASELFLLVDLSETWHNLRDDARNLRVLTEIGMASAEAAETISSDSGAPVAVQARIIGAGSLEREPACDVVYLKQMIATQTDKEYQLGDLRSLRSYLGTDCPAKLLALPPEPRTEISNALLSVANRGAAGAANRKIVIASDFLEEASQPVSPLDLEGYDVLMLYRPLPQDQADPEAMRLRVLQWKQLLGSLKATVRAVPDTGIKRETIAEFLNSPPPADGARHD
jgi:hypothetical protein